MLQKAIKFVEFFVTPWYLVLNLLSFDINPINIINFSILKKIIFDNKFFFYIFHFVK